jgi:hypothetical protein
MMQVQVGQDALRKNGTGVNSTTWPKGAATGTESKMANADPGQVIGQKERRLVTDQGIFF